MSEQETPAVPADANQPQQPAAPAYETPVTQEEPKKSSGLLKKIIGFVVVAAIVLVVKFGLGDLWANITGEVQTASVGDCITAWVKADDAKVVDCNDPEAKNKVVGIVEDKYTSAQFDTVENPCTDFATAESAIWVGRTGTGDVWCMAAK